MIDSIEATISGLEQCCKNLHLPTEADDALRQV